MDSSATPGPLPASDAALLTGFASAKDGRREAEAAFAKVVERHSRLVYATARRLLHDHDEALDVSQRVFTLLARKVRAGLHVRESVAGWLYRAAVNCSREALRGQRVRAKAEKAAASVAGLSAGSPDTTLAMMLDEALTNMSGMDRQLILRRYGEGASCRELSEETGKSEAAVQKQAVRALEKLAASLRRRGVTVPAAAVSAALSTGGFSRQVAAADLAARALSATDLPRAGTLAGLISLMKLGKLTWTAALCAFLAPTAIQTVTRAGIPRVEKAVQPAVKTLPAAASLRTSKYSASGETFPDSILKEIIAANPNREPLRFLRLAERVGTLNRDQVVALWEALNVPIRNKPPEFVKVLFARWAELDADEAVRRGMEANDKPDSSQLAAKWKGIASVLAAREGANLFARLFPGGIPWEDLSKDTRSPRWTAIYSSFLCLGEVNPEKAIEALFGMPESQVQRSLDVGVMEGAAGLPETAWTALQQLPDTSRRKELMREFINQMGNTNPAAGIGLLIKPENAPYAAEFLPRVLKDLTGVDPQAAVAAWSRLPLALKSPQMTDALLLGRLGLTVNDFMKLWQPAIDEWASKDPGGANLWQRENYPAIYRMLAR